MRHLRVMLVVALVASLALTGCGQSQGESYCDAVSARSKDLADMVQSQSADALLSRTSMLQRLSAKAPSDLRDEWQTFLAAVEGLRRALRAADLRAGDVADGNFPAAVSTAQKQAVMAAATRLSSGEVAAAADGIEQQARDVCKVNIGLGAAP